MDTSLMLGLTFSFAVGLIRCVWLDGRSERHNVSPEIESWCSESLLLQPLRDA